MEVTLVDENDPDYEGGYVYGYDVNGEGGEWHTFTCTCEVCHVERRELLERVAAASPPPPECPGVDGDDGCEGCEGCPEPPRGQTADEILNPNPPKDTDGRREESGRGGEGATGEIAWVPFGVGRSADGLHRRTGAPMAVCGSCDARDGERIRSRGLSRPGWHESAGIFGCPVGGSVADGAVRPGVEWLAAGPRRG